MPVTITPYIPRYITVHLGAPGQNAENVTVTFPDYIKNVASSEIYPTWEPSALRANILAQVSFALNRVYTEYYPSRGYPFQITSTTAMDQKFIRGRNIFENIERIVDELFDDYIRRQGYAEPLSANSATGPLPPVTASPNGAARSSPSRGWTAYPFCAVITETISSLSWMPRYKMSVPLTRVLRSAWARGALRSA